ncbi:hypothetical protein L2E82_04331 [Cichorium intybus]|uniref:Uncharacterized protein n=1 Tax=Cichorium intybus TaxID=13427 RepID=A0ACB9H5D7_CICIN|nr:hypothetical protein L2E82_04331 [Cichorium intybus]
MQDSKKGSLQLYHGINLSKPQCLTTSDAIDKMSRVPYASAIGSIMYAMTSTCPDVSFALSIVEYIATKEAGKEVTWLKNFIGDLGVVLTIHEPVEIFCDNEYAITLTKKPKDHGRSRHILRKYHYVRHKVESGDIVVYRVLSEDSSNDPFTKVLSKIKHDEHAKSIGMRGYVSFSS